MRTEAQIFRGFSKDVGIMRASGREGFTTQSGKEVGQGKSCVCFGGAGFGRLSKGVLIAICSLAAVATT